MIRVGILGASGYAGLELLKLLLAHPDVQIIKLFGFTTIGEDIASIHPVLRGMFSMTIEDFSPNALNEIDLLFVSLPSGQSMTYIPSALEAGCTVIDLGGDFRLSNPEIFKQYYEHDHTATHLLSTSVYGLTEWNSGAIKHAQLIANPGCYPTSILLALLPLLKNNLLASSPLGITAYSGTSGAGKSVTEKMIFAEVNESVRAYKVGSHQHIPEIKQYCEFFGGVEVNFSFIPHLLPTTRGIYTTIHAVVNEGVDDHLIRFAFNEAYSTSSFVRFIAPSIPEMKNVVNTNSCDISYALQGEQLVLFSTIDNLLKGAAGQAVQNMNVRYGHDDAKGILPWFRKNI